MDIVEDIKQNIAKVLAVTGVEPNTIVIPEATWASLDEEVRQSFRDAAKVEHSLYDLGNDTDKQDIHKYLPTPPPRNLSVDQLVDLGIRAKKAYNDHMKDKQND